MSDQVRDLTPLEAAVLRTLAKPAPVGPFDARADFCIRAFLDPSELVQAVFNSVDWDVILQHMEETR
jgi:hypothetical protein